MERLLTNPIVHFYEIPMTLYIAKGYGALKLIKISQFLIYVPPPLNSCLKISYDDNHRWNWFLPQLVADVVACLLNEKDQISLFDQISDFRYLSLDIYI